MQCDEGHPGQGDPRDFNISFNKICLTDLRFQYYLETLTKRLKTEKFIDLRSLSSSHSLWFTMHVQCTVELYLEHLCHRFFVGHKLLGFPLSSQYCTHEQQKINRVNLTIQRFYSKTLNS